MDAMRNGVQSIRPCSALGCNEDSENHRVTEAPKNYSVLRLFLTLAGEVTQ